MSLLSRLFQRGSNSRIQEDRESTDSLLPLPSDDATDLAKEFRTSYTRPRPTESFISPANVFTILACVGCTALNWYISNTYFSPGNQSLVEGPGFCSISRDAYTTLRRPSPFIGFDQIHRPSPPIPRRLINYPLAIAPVNASNPEQVFDNDPKRHLTRSGSVSPEDRLVMISNTISTIVQFRAFDYGMERCDLHLRLLTSTMRQLPEPRSISIYLLNSEHALDAKIISYSNRPNRVYLAGSLSPSRNPGPIEWHREFHCPWDSLLTFELTYDVNTTTINKPGDKFDHVVEWLQDKESDSPEEGIFIIQRETM